MYSELEKIAQRIDKLIVDTFGTEPLPSGHTPGAEFHEGRIYNSPGKIVCYTPDIGTEQREINRAIDQILSANFCWCQIYQIGNLNVRVRVVYSKDCKDLEDKFQRMLIPYLGYGVKEVPGVLIPPPNFIGVKANPCADSDIYSVPDISFVIPSEKYDLIGVVQKLAKRYKWSMITDYLTMDKIECTNILIYPNQDITRDIMKRFARKKD